MIVTVLIAVGLAMDAFAVSITKGLAMKNPRLGSALKIALFFGTFQALMPVIGWVAGVNVIDLISGVDHWIAFSLLLPIHRANSVISKVINRSKSRCYRFKFIYYIAVICHI